MPIIRTFPTIVSLLANNGGEQYCTMFKFSFYALLGISALMIYSWASLFSLPAQARVARWSNKRNVGGITLLFCAVSGLVWYFQHIGYQGAANLTLYVLYGALVLGFLCWIRKRRGN